MDRKKHEIWALCLLTISLLVLFSLLSYHEKDPTIFFSSKDFTRNWVGAFGANIAWPLIAFFGLGAYGLVIAGFWASWRLFREPVIERTVVPALGYHSSHLEHDDPGRPALRTRSSFWARNSKPAEKSAGASLDFLTTGFRRWVRIRY